MIIASKIIASKTLAPRLGFTLAALTAFGLAAASPAAAGTLAAAGSVVYGSAATSFFQPTYGTDGFIEFGTTPTAQTAGHFVYSKPLFADAPTSTTYITQPAYISGFTGFDVDHASGYGYLAIATGRQAGFVGYGSGDGGGNILSFTVGTTKSFVFGVLANYSTQAGENPLKLTLTGSGSTPVSVSNPGSGATSATEYLYSITNAAPGETFTLSTDQGYIAGITFDPAAAPAVPEASTMVGFGLLLALGGLAVVSRRRKTA